MIYIIYKIEYPQDVDNFFQNERNRNTSIAALSKVATEVHYLNFYFILFFSVFIWPVDYKSFYNSVCNTVFFSQ